MQYRGLQIKELLVQNGSTTFYHLLVFFNMPSRKKSILFASVFRLRYCLRYVKMEI